MARAASVEKVSSQECRDLPDFLVVLSSTCEEGVVAAVIVCGEAASEKFLSAARFVRPRGRPAAERR